jgi:3-methylfumaryl-CoA hydratase
MVTLRLQQAVSQIDLDHLRRWVGRSRLDDDVIAARHARLMAATVDHYAPERIRDGEPLPALWHWLYFLEGMPARELGRDGHPARGAFLPPVPLANRMWAGGRVRFLAPVPIGAAVRRKSTILRVDHKAGRSGDLVFVTVLHELESLAGAGLIHEEHDIVYKDPSPSAAAAIPVPDGVPLGQFTRSFVPTSTTLFRYSALTFNGHRIHYDADYCREVEGYPHLVVHGPLLATLLAGFAEEVTGRRLRDFSYRALSPAFLGATVTLHCDVRERHADARAALDDGRTCMQAEMQVE